MPLQRSVAAALTILITTVVGTAISTAPTPLYPVYRVELGLDSLGVTATFAAFALGAVLGLALTAISAGRLDRRAAFLLAGCLQVTAALVLAVAPGTVGFSAGRVLSGIGAGVLAASGTGYLLEATERIRSPRTAAGLRALAPAAVYLGLGAGPLIGGTVGAQDLQRIQALFAALGCVVLVTLFASRALTDPTIGRGTPGRSRGGRPPMRPALGAFTAFMTTGLFGALSSTMLAVLHIEGALATGLLAALVFVGGAIGVVLLGQRLGHRAAAVLLAVGFAAVAGAIAAQWAVMFIVAGALAGLASGALFAGSLRGAISARPPQQAFRVTTLLFASAYTGLAAPVLGLGALLLVTPVTPAVTAFALLGISLCALLVYFKS